jgi:short-subunit dehydrogenase
MQKEMIITEESVQVSDIVIADETSTSVQECDAETSSAQAATFLLNKEQDVQASVATKLNGYPKADLPKNKNSFYTLITGSSSGIGKALALECASKGMNVLLIALAGEELYILEKQIRSEFNVMCDSFGVDLSVHCSSSAVYNWVKENGYKINVLINNVGVGSKGAFEQLSPDFYYTQIHLNVMTTCMMTRLFIDDLKVNAPSHILNVGSMGGFFMLPHKIVYSATKAFVYTFSQGLRMEIKPFGITVSVLCPGGTDSNERTTAINKDLKGLARTSILQPHEVAKEAIDKMLKGKARIIPGFLNKFSYHVGRVVPEFIHRMIIARTFSHVKKHEYSD